MSDRICQRKAKASRHARWPILLVIVALLLSPLASNELHAETPPATEPALVITNGTHEQRFTANQLASRPDVTTVKASSDIYHDAVTYRAVPLLALLGAVMFLIAAGLTLVFGVMDFINLAHGVQYMLGAYLAVMFYGLTGNFFFALILALIAALVFGLLLEFVVFRHLYDRDHLDQVIATFGIIMLLNQSVKLIWGPAPLTQIRNLFMA